MRESEATIHEPTTPDHAAGGGRAADVATLGVELGLSEAQQRA